MIGRFWPQGSPDKLRAAAGVWRRAAELIDEAQRHAEQHAAPISVYCSGETITAFTTYVRRIYAADPSGNTVVDPGEPLMENLSAACRQLQRICEQYADAIDDCRHTLIALGVTAGIITTAGVLLTIFTLGGSDAAAAAGDAALAADAAVAAEALADAEAELAAASAIAEAEAVIDSALAKLLAAGVVTTGVVLGTAGSASAAGPQLSSFAALPATATVPPLPPGLPSGVFPPFSLSEQAAAAAWAATLQTRDPVYGTPDDIAYQIRTAGQPERYLPTADGSGVWADGYRDTDGALIDAKHVRNPGCSPRTLQGLSEENLARPGSSSARTMTRSPATATPSPTPPTTPGTSRSTPTTRRPWATGSTWPRKTMYPPMCGMSPDPEPEGAAARSPAAKMLDRQGGGSGRALCDAICSGHRRPR